MDASGRTSAAIVTGASRGIGRVIALRLAQCGPIVAVARDEDQLLALVAEIRRRPGRAEIAAGDIADPTTAARAIEVACENGWSPGHLVCNAGIGKSGPTDSFPVDLWRRVFDVNVHGCFHFLQACLPEMLKRGCGVITIMSSLAGVRGVPFDAAYTATKHALVGLSRALHLEFGKRGIVVTALCPGFVAGEMTDRTIRGMMKRRGLSQSEAEERLAAKCPAGRILSPEEIAETVALLGEGRLDAALALAEKGGYPLIHGSETTSNP
jgi:NAD(P)-dependent dehydrogenase (short-subunit alcohol dehydrogenase family)